MAVGTTAALALSRRDHTRRSMVERHLRRVRGPGLTGRALDRAVRASFESYGRYWVESLRTPHLTPQELDSRMSWHGVGHLEDAVTGGKGAIIALPHLGGWDQGGAWLCHVGYPRTVVSERLAPPSLCEGVVAF